MPKEKKKAINPEEKILGAMAYLWVLCLVPLLTRKNSEFCQFHAKQGLIIFWGSFVTLFLGMIPLMVGNVFLSVGWLLVWCMLIVVASLVGLVNVWRGEKGEIPLVADYAKKVDL